MCTKRPGLAEVCALLSASVDVCYCILGCCVAGTVSDELGALRQQHAQCDRVPG